MDQKFGISDQFHNIPELLLGLGSKIWEIMKKLENSVPFYLSTELDLLKCAQNQKIWSKFKTFVNPDQSKSWFNPFFTTKIEKIMFNMQKYSWNTQKLGIILYFYKVCPKKFYISQRNFNQNWLKFY